MPKSRLWKETIKTLTAITAILILSLVMIAVAFAIIVEQPIKANEGGTIDIVAGIKFIVPPGALERDTTIRVKMVQNRNKTMFKFGPAGLKFKKAVKLQATTGAINDAAEFNLYYAPNNERPDNYTEVITPERTSDGTIQWSLNHFSIYYYRRR